MRLLFIANDFPNPYQPTKGVFNLALAKGLLQRHDVRVIAPVAWTDEWAARRRGLPPLKRASVIDGVSVRHPRYVFPPKILRNQYAWFYHRSIRRTLCDVLEGFSPDAVVGYWAHPDGAVAVRVARSLGVASAVIVGGSDVLVITRDPGRRGRVSRVLAAADAVVTVNRHLRDRSVELGAEASRVHVWAQGVDGDVFYPGDRETSRLRLGLPAAGGVLVWVGRMVPVKGLDVLLAAAKRLHDMRVPFSLHLIGDGPLRPTLQATVESLGLENDVHFVGPRPHEHLADWYRAADLTVLPSRSEGLPNVLRESLACGTPFVASDVGGIRELCGPGSGDGGWGRLVKPEDPAALAEAIRGALASPPSLAPLMAPPTWGQSADALVRILRPLLPGDGPEAGRLAALSIVR